MEDLLLSFSESRILQKFKKRLESFYKVNIYMPEINKYESHGSEEIIYVSLHGDKKNINNVKEFLKRKFEAKKRKKQENNATVIILDHSEEENNLPVINADKPRLTKVCSESQDVTPTVSPCSYSCVSKDMPFPNNTLEFSKRKFDAKKRKKQENNATVIILDHSEEKNNLPEINADKPRLTKVCSESQEVTPTVSPCSYSCVSKDVPFPNNTLDESVIIIDSTPPAENFIPLSSELKPKTPAAIDIDVIDLSSDDDEESTHSQNIQPIIRHLRPVVIDGSNVARQHGKPNNTFSCKGIKISVEYFLKRGHPQVTVFVPLYRRHCNKGKYPTTDEHILDELEKNKNLVYTPSRRLNGKLINSYDDRFIVKLASQIGGVILSNDNYKDLVGESEDFREVIEKRLVMFCFAGDIFMIPSDPLGMHGPSIEEVLSFPPTENPVSPS